MKYRKDRLEELIKRIVSEIILRELKDPRIGFITVTGVELNRDLSEAKIGVSILGSPTEVRKSMEGIRSSSGYVQKLLGKELKIRSVPRVYFFLDKSVEEGVELVNRIEKLAGVEKSSAETDSDDDYEGEGEE
ncbi:MAG TPA: 30S ribosome-binding factor RbfA [Spirochaetota bacterium]|nr:30S ribosome-binding factor RbfA [Spirochaetota bacterium]